MKRLNIIASVYLILCGTLNVLSFFVILSKGNLSNNIALFSIPLLGFSIIVIIINNIILLRRPNNSSRKNALLINLIICGLQVFRFFLSGFQYKLNQGLELVIFASKKSGEINFGAYLGNFDLSLTITFNKLNSAQLEINIIMLVLTIFYWIQLSIRQDHIPHSKFD